jgi:pentatricopeptide repeat protein
VLREIAFGSATREGIAFGSIWDVPVVNSLVDMYAKCGSMDDAWRVLNKMPSRDVVTWTAVLADVHCTGMVRKLLNISNGCVKKVCSQMISLLFHFCQLVAMQV